MNQQDRIQTGNWNIFRFLTGTQVDYPDSEDHLTQTICTFDYTDTLITLARINLLLQRADASEREGPLEREEILQKNFCSRLLRDEINRRGFTEHFIFHREATLRLLEKSASLADGRFGPAPDATVDTKNDLARCYLIVNKLLEREKEFPDFRSVSTKVQPKELLAALIPDLEYAINPSPWTRIKNMLVRSNEFLTRLQNVCATFDVKETFRKATGLTLQDYQHLIFSILGVSLEFTSEEILEGTVLFVNTKPSPILEPLYDRLLRHTCIPVEELAPKMAEVGAEKKRNLPNEFRLWRKYPLVKTDDNQIMCVDISFLAEKLETGVFWLLLSQLKKEKSSKDKEMIGLRGQVFEDYTASIIERGINVQTSSNIERCIIRPNYIQKQQAECTDIAVCGNDTLILLECKAPLLSAETKFSGNFHEFHKGIQHSAIKGIEQLWNAIQTLGHTNKKERRKVGGIDMSKVKKIYPVLVLSDHIFSFLFMNEFLDSEFQRFVKYKYLKKHLKLMPLTVLTIADLEDLEPYLKDTPFHTHLDKWITQEFLPNRFFPFSNYLRTLRAKDRRQNKYMEQEFQQLIEDMTKYFSERGLVD